MKGMIKKHQCKNSAQLEILAIFYFGLFWHFKNSTQHNKSIFCSRKKNVCSKRKQLWYILGKNEIKIAWVIFDNSIHLISCIRECIFFEGLPTITIYAPHEPIFQWKIKKYTFFPRAEKWAHSFAAWLTYFRNGTRSPCIKKFHFIRWP